MAADIWAVADLLRGDYKRHEYGQVILPFTVLRRLDAVMAPAREAVRARDAALSIENKEKLLERTAAQLFPVRYRALVPYKGARLEGELPAFLRRRSVSDDAIVEVT